MATPVRFGPLSASPFYGYSDERVDLWIKNLEHLQQIYQLTDQALLSLAAMNFRGMAASWYETLTYPPTEWSYFKGLLMERFPPIVKLTYFKQQLFEAFQEPHEKLFDYVSRMQVLGSNCGADETDIKEAVYKGCHGCFRPWLQSGLGKASRLNELFQVAKRADAFSMTVDRPNAIPPRTQDFPIVSTPQVHFEATQVSNESLNALTARLSDDDVRVLRQILTKISGGTSSTPKDYKIVKCEKCGRIGHRTEVCYDRIKEMEKELELLRGKKKLKMHHYMMKDN